MDRTRAFFIQIGILLIVLLALAALLGNKLQMTFLANPWINGFIALIWVIGVIHALAMVFRLRKEYVWLSSVDSPWIPEVTPISLNHWPQWWTNNSALLPKHVKRCSMLYQSD